MKTHALVTGGLGLIGSAITRRLISNNVVDTVVALDHYGRYVSSLRSDFVDYRKYRIQGYENHIIIERGESKYPLLMMELLQRYKPIYIFHLAALPLAKLDNLNSAEAMNGSVDSTANILESCGILKRASIYEPERFVYASSSMVYGDFQSEQANEDHPTNPKEIYGTMKLAGEVITRGLGNFYGIKYAIIRPSAVYGPTDMNRRVSQIFVEKALTGQKIKVHGEDEALDFTYVEDAANGFVLAAIREGGINQIFNITHGKAHLLTDYIIELKKYFPNLEYEVVERDGFRPKRGTLCIDKARRLLGYEPSISFSEGIRQQIVFARTHFKLNKDER